MNCRHCYTPLEYKFLDLGYAPPSNAYLNKEDLQRPEIYLPLRVAVCHKCWLVQTEDYAQAENLFAKQYAYFSSTSTSWLDHAKKYFEKITHDLNLNGDSYVIEVASNDGYLLRNFQQAGIPCLGVEPTDSTADVAELAGIEVVRDFFSNRLANQLVEKNRKADLIIANNVYAHVPDINDFTLGLKSALKDEGTITLEFPHLMELIENIQFDTIYHEHFSYLSLNTVTKIFVAAGLKIWNVEKLETHGGSLRVYGCHASDSREIMPSVQIILDLEIKKGLHELSTYLNFQDKVDKIKNDFLMFLISLKSQKKNIAAYGAAAKGNTLLNYAGVKPDLLPYVCDAAQAKQSKFMPGSHIPILAPCAFDIKTLDYILILPWNISKEVMSQNERFRNFGIKFVTAIPAIKIYD